MNVHYKINPSTVDKGELPTHLTAGTVMGNIADTVFPIARRASKAFYQELGDCPTAHDPAALTAYFAKRARSPQFDHWVNSTTVRGIRSHRIRFAYLDDATTKQLLQQIRDALQPYASVSKIYKYKNDHCIMLYYRSWQAGEPRK